MHIGCLALTIVSGRKSSGDRKGVHELLFLQKTNPNPGLWGPSRTDPLLPLKPFAFSSEKKAHYCHILSFCIVFSAHGYIFSGIGGLLCTPTPSLNYMPPLQTLHSYFRKRVHVKFCSLLTFPISCHDVGDLYELWLLNPCVGTEMPLSGEVGIDLRRSN